MKATLFFISTLLPFAFYFRLPRERLAFLLLP